MLWGQHFWEEEVGGLSRGELNCSAVTKWPWPVQAMAGCSEAGMTRQRWSEES